MPSSNALPGWRSYCPVARTLDLVGDKWTLVVVRDLLLGMTRYDQFLDRPERIATNELAARLKKLEGMGDDTRHRYGEHARRFEYRLTSRGEELRPLVQSIVDWGLGHIPGSETHLWPRSESSLRDKSLSSKERKGKS
ncbi:MAG: helix-turn-helix domain-containing protein [Planctomycetota bacterium]